MRLTSIISATCLVFCGLTTGAGAADLFDNSPASTDFRVFPGWQRVMTEARQETTASPSKPLALANPVSQNTAPSAGFPKGNLKDNLPSKCATEECLSNEWKRFIQATRNLPKSQQLSAVNSWANKRPYVEDWAKWGIPDYWETPKEFLAQGGDCEDFAIIKYFTLVALGVNPDDMRISIVYDENLEIYHAVLAVRQENGSPLVLDNQAKDVIPMSMVPQYRLIYSLNERGWWLASTPKLVVTRAKKAS